MANTKKNKEVSTAKKSNTVTEKQTETVGANVIEEVNEVVEEKTNKKVLQKKNFVVICIDKNKKRVWFESLEDKSLVITLDGNIDYQAGQLVKLYV